jgi:formylglycine-generating enzyme required for sulfatase activity
VLDGLLRRIALLPDDDDATLYPFRRALYHEDAGETIAALLQALGWRRPSRRRSPGARPGRRHAAFSGRNFTQGWSDADGFAWPDELPRRRSMCRRSRWMRRWSPTPSSWSSSRTAATSILVLVDGGPPVADDAGALRAALLVAPCGDAKLGGVALRRERTLNPDEPVRHVTLFEAQAWCVWAGRRLPQEVEWELAATQNRGLQWGALREWTATPYEPYLGFNAEPTDGEIVGRFGTHQAVRGVSSPALRDCAIRGHGRAAAGGRCGVRSGRAV